MQLKRQGNEKKTTDKHYLFIIISKLIKTMKRNENINTNNMTVEKIRENVKLQNTIYEYFNLF
jgi:hypothetical protein